MPSVEGVDDNVPPSGYGVSGRSNNRHGVYDHSGGYGVYGHTTSGYGVVGESRSSFGVIGRSNSGCGVMGGSGSSYGVIG